MKQLPLLATILFSLILGANTYNYKDAKNWGKKYSKCNGKNQSPIIIKPNYDREPIYGYSSISQTMKLTDFQKLPTRMTIKNTGHTVEIKADWSGEPPSVSGGPLPHGNYVFEKAAFRWGEQNDRKQGVYDSKEYNILSDDMEMYMYFYRADLESFEKAQSQKGGLAVFVKWLEVQSQLEFQEFGESLEEYEKSLGKLEKRLKEVEDINSTAVIPPFALTSLPYADGTIRNYIFYEGSLDHPPCFESVTWFIDRDNTYITDTLLNEFRKLKMVEGDKSNIRPTQPLNNREAKLVYHD